jgi:hypothetical protein
MSLRKGERRGRTLLAAVLASAAAATLAPSIAAASCASSPTSTPFAQFGDMAQYSLAPGGSFESGTTGWSLYGAAVANGNESYDVAGTHSLALQAGGRAVSPWVCIGSEYPTWRFFARRSSGSSTSTLYVGLRWVNVLGLGVESGAGYLQSGEAWSPSPVMKLGNSLPLWLPGSTLAVQLVFQASGGGSWAVDDVYIDPYRR